jgi:hypothetical protein
MPATRAMSWTTTGQLDGPGRGSHLHVRAYGVMNMARQDIALLLVAGALVLALLAIAWGHVLHRRRDPPVHRARGNR